MLPRKSLAAVATFVLATALPCSAQAAMIFQTGDLVTHRQDIWGNPTTDAGVLLVNHYDSVYASTFGVLEVGIPGAGGFSMAFTTPFAVHNYLPNVGSVGPLMADLVNPTSTASGAFGGEATALHLNVDFSDAGHTAGTLGIPFGDLQFHSLTDLPQLNGLTVRHFLGDVDVVLGGGDVGYSITLAYQTAVEVNASFGGGEPSQFAQDHLRLPAVATVPEPASAILLLLGVFGLAAGRRRT